MEIWEERVIKVVSGLKKVLNHLKFDTSTSEQL